ncbi:MAG: hypothetical protein IT445_05080 [Phycisphaeraceae bacterium]|nr:hypothetical protein [Phycisphaeraceae bacterium]
MRMLYVITALALAAALAGCSTAPSMTREGPTLDRNGRPRSLALDSRPMIRLAADQPDAWWSARNDLPRAVAVPNDGLLYDVTEVRTYDRLYSHDGRVHDHFRQHTYSTRVRSHTP